MPKGKGYKRRSKRSGGRIKRVPKGRKRSPRRIGLPGPFKMKKD